MKYLLSFILALTLLDLLRSFVAKQKATKEFKKYSQHKTTPPTEFGTGKPFHLVIMGDSTFDVRGDSQVVYGPAQVFIDTLSQRYRTHVHMLAKAGAKSRDVVELQLPQLKRLKHIDLLVVYMGANDAFVFKNPLDVGKNYATLLNFTEQRKIPVVAAEIANYWYLSIFALVHRAWLYLAIHIQNAEIRRAVAPCKYVTLVKTKTYHAQLHKKRSVEPYLADGVHATDKAALAWGNYLLGQAKQGPATAKAFQLR